jgi:hypothetical protein
MSEVERSVGILVMSDKKKLEIFGNLLARSVLSWAISTSQPVVCAFKVASSVLDGRDFSL